MQPHPELVERQPHRHAVDQRRDFRRLAHRPPEHAETAHRCQQKYPVVQVVHMRPVEEEIKVRHQVRHDEEDADPRQHESHHKAEQRSTRQLVRCLTRDGMS